jgi:hypothetical protein
MGPDGPVAIKFALSYDWSQVLDRESGLLCEAQLPGVVRFLEAEAGGRWMAMSWVEGEHASTWADGQDLAEVAILLRKFSRTLAQLHGHGMVHGDLAPANMLVDAENTPHLLDFGLGVGTEPITDRIGMHGTPGYVAPELLDGGSPNPQTDLYGLGALAYRMLTGHHPFANMELHALQLHPRRSLPRPPSSTRIEIPLELDALVLRLLSRDPSGRPGAAQVEGLWEEMAARRPARPIVGNEPIRSALREAIAQAQDGARIFALLHGPMGSGRQTLIQEASRIAALGGLDPLILDFGDLHDPSELQGVLRDALPQGPGLCLIRARQAFDDLESLGLLHLRTAPLSTQDISQLMRFCSQDPEPAEVILQQTQGHPAAVWAHLGFPAEEPEAALPEQALLMALLEGPESVEFLAARLGISEHGVLDLAEPLLDQGAIIELEDGAVLGLPGLSI